jgi:adenylyltransferase/sulfurtransferase
MGVPWEIQPEELQQLRAKGEAMLLLDCREANEWQFNRIEGAVHIPLMQIPARAGELDPAKDIVVYCHSGNRSLNAVAFLRQMGYERARSLAGGIDAWSSRIDPNVPRY